jgi:hypothetical protein
MLFIFLSFIAYVAAIVVYLIANKNKKTSLFSITSYIITGTFFFGIVIVFFYLIKFNGNANILLFPDEITYLYNIYYVGFFDMYVKLMYNIGGIELVRAINIFSFFLGQLFIINLVTSDKFSSRGLFFRVFIIIALSIFSYWVYFVLKEAFTFLGIALYLSSQEGKSRNMKIAAFLIIFITRLNLFALIILVELLTKIYQRIKGKIVIMLVFLFLTVINIFNSPISFAYKYGILASRFGSAIGQRFDDAARSTASKGFFSFVFSKEYFQLIITNLNETFNPLVGNSIFIKMMILINLVAVLLIFLYIKPKIDKSLIVFISITILLLATYSSFRYINSIIIPFCIYFYVQKNKKRRSNFL